MEVIKLRLAKQRSAKDGRSGTIKRAGALSNESLKRGTHLNGVTFSLQMGGFRAQFPCS
jgi:hypothetical protein